MNPMEKPITLPLDAIGALELGQTVEAVNIVRQELGVDVADARTLIDVYTREHPPAPDRPRIPATVPGWLWVSAASLLLVLTVTFVWL